MKYPSGAMLGTITICIMVYLITGCGAQVTEDLIVAAQQTVSPTAEGTIPPADVSTPPVSISENAFTPNPSSAVKIETQTGSPSAGDSDYSTNEPFIQAAIRDLQNRLNFTAELVKIASVEPVEWNDASLGCAKPGSISAQVITPGYLVILQVNDVRYAYHTNSGTRVILCGEDGFPVSTDFSLPADPNIDDGQPWMPAD